MGSFREGSECKHLHAVDVVEEEYMAHSIHTSQWHASWKFLEVSSMGSMDEVSRKVRIGSTYISVGGILVHITIGHSDSCILDVQASTLPQVRCGKCPERFLHWVHVGSFWEGSNSKHLPPVDVEHKYV